MTDPLILAARFLAEHVEWIRHRPEAAEVLADIDAARRILVGLIDGPAPGRYLGPCEAVDQLDVSAFGEPPGTVLRDGAPCEGDVYAREGSDHGTCRTCGARFNVAERRAWLDDEVRSRAFRAAHIADAYGLRANTIRVWADRGQIRTFYALPDSELAEWTETDDEDEIDARGYRLFLVGEVLDLAAQAAARRATNEARRARRREDEAA